MVFGTIAKWVWAIGESFPHDVETVRDRGPWCIQLSLYNRFWYLEYPKCFILGTRLCLHCHRSQSFMVLPKTRQIPGTGVFQADSRQGSFTMPGTSQTVHDYKPCTIGRQSHTFSFPAPYVIVSNITHTLCKQQLCACLHMFPFCEPSRIMVYIANVCVLPTVCAVVTCTP